VNLEKFESDLVVILGPTASGKTQLAVDIALALNGEIISADSRQVYRGMNVGTGKDLSEYQRDETFVSNHLIDICAAGEKYNVARFQSDFVEVFEEIKCKGKLPILCGGTGLYIQAVLSDFWQIHIPIDTDFRKKMESMSVEDIFKEYSNELENYTFSSKKRLVRKIEQERYLVVNEGFKKEKSPDFSFNIFGLNPDLPIRRERISSRLRRRMDGEGMLEEVKALITNGLDMDMLEYYGLEYKYISYYLASKMNYAEMLLKLEVEIHRYAKRQMTFFRSMERKGFKINWIPEELNRQQKVDFVLSNLVPKG
jgi:tRNA dimethylallyltransferase